MIILAQFPSTRWIAVLLSADGNPDIDTDDDGSDDKAGETDDNKAGEPIAST